MRSSLELVLLVFDTDLAARAETSIDVRTAAEVDNF